MKWVYPGMPKRRSQGPWGEEPGRSHFGLFRCVLALLGSPCPPEAPFIKKTLMKTYSCMFLFPGTNEKLSSVCFVLAFRQHMAVSCLFPCQGGSQGGPGGSRGQGEARLPQKPLKTLRGHMALSHWFPYQKRNQQGSVGTDSLPTWPRNPKQGRNRPK